MNSNPRIPNKSNSNGIYQLNAINSAIINGNWPNSFYEPNPSKILSSNYYTEAGLGDNLITTFSEHITIDISPSAPTNLTVSVGNAQLALTWTAPTTYGTAITNYVVEYTPSGGLASTVSTNSTSTSYTLTGLINDTTYVVRVAGVNSIGIGEFSTASAAVAPSTNDPFFASVSLLLPFDGTGATFVDASATPKTITAFGGAAQSATESKFGGKSGYFNGSSHLTAGGFANIGTQDFTIECWLFPTSLSGLNILWDFRPLNGNFPTLYADNTTVNYYVNEVDQISGTLTQSAWQHVVVSRAAGTTRMYIDGSQVGISWSDNTSYLSSVLSVGRSFANAFGRFYMDDLRITIGHARYTANFTPPALAFPTS